MKIFCVNLHISYLDTPLLKLVQLRTEKFNYIDLSVIESIDFTPFQGSELLVANLR